VSASKPNAPERALPPTAYRLVLTATDAADISSARVTTRFRIVGEICAGSAGV
jgi:hypothetical protein